MSELGYDVVHKYQGKEPSGRKINEIVLDYNSKWKYTNIGTLYSVISQPPYTSDKPHNPLINSGALVSASLILQMVKPELTDMAQKYDYLFQLFEVFKISCC